MNQCEAKSKRTGERCRNRPMKGKGVCRMHGGKSPIKHGLYSKYENPEARGHIEAAKRLPAITILEQTIPMAAGLLSFWMETGIAWDNECYQATTALIGRLTKAVESYEKLTNPELRTGKLIIEHDYHEMSDQDLIDAILETQHEAESICRVAAEREAQT